MVVRLALHFGAGTFVYVQTQPLQTVGIGNIVEHNLECVFNADVVEIVLSNGIDIFHCVVKAYSALYDSVRKTVYRGCFVYKKHFAAPFGFMWNFYSSSLSLSLKASSRLRRSHFGFLISTGLFCFLEDSSPSSSSSFPACIASYSESKA